MTTVGRKQTSYLRSKQKTRQQEEVIMSPAWCGVLFWADRRTGALEQIPGAATLYTDQGTAIPWSHRLRCLHRRLNEKEKWWARQDYSPRIAWLALRAAAAVRRRSLASLSRCSSRTLRFSSWGVSNQSNRAPRGCPVCLVGPPGLEPGTKGL